MTKAELAQEASKIAFGWMLGLASPIMWEWQRRRRRTKELKASITSELNDLRYRMAWVAFVVRSNRGNVDAEFLTWLEPIVQGYTGAETHPELVAGLKNMRELLARQPDLAPQKLALVGVALKEYTLPLLRAHMSEISQFPIKFQAAVLTVAGHLDLFNPSALGKSDPGLLAKSDPDNL